MGSKASQSQSSIADSYNRSLDQVLNVSDSGNVKINFGDAAVRAGTGTTDWLPIAGLGVAGVALIVWALKD